MNFGSGGSMDKEAWKGHLGRRPGVGQVRSAPTVSDLVGGWPR